MRRTARCLLGLAVALGAVGCREIDPELKLRISLPADRELLRAVVRLDLHAERDGRVIAQHTFPGDATYVSLSGVSHGPKTIFELDGITAQGDVAGRGRSCPTNYTGPGPEVPLYFAPLNFFNPTAPPAASRTQASVLQLDSGEILLFGGSVEGIPQASAERFTAGLNQFTAAPTSALGNARARAVVSPIPNIGTLVSGGIGVDGNAIGNAEVWRPTIGAFVPLLNPRLVPRVDHIAVTLADGRVFIAGGRASNTGSALASTAIVRVLNDGTAVVNDGPTLGVGRHSFAAVVAPGSVVLFGGYGDGVGGLQPLDSIEIIDLHAGVTTTPTVKLIPEHLNAPRAEATATLLEDGTILLVGGKDAASTHDDAELWNPVTRQSESLALATARSGHQATLLDGGRVLITGGVDSTGTPLHSVELYIPGVGFVSERPLANARAGHVTTTLCDGTVLVVGGGSGAEVYTPPSG